MISQPAPLPVGDCLASLIRQGWNSLEDQETGDRSLKIYWMESYISLHFSFHTFFPRMLQQLFKQLTSAFSFLVVFYDHTGCDGFTAVQENKRCNKQLPIKYTYIIPDLVFTCVASQYLMLCARPPHHFILLLQDFRKVVCNEMSNQL